MPHEAEGVRPSFFRRWRSVDAGKPRIAGWSRKYDQHHADNAQHQKCGKRAMVTLREIEGCPRDEGTQGEARHLYRPLESVDRPQVLATIVVGKQHCGQGARAPVCASL